MFLAGPKFKNPLASLHRILDLLTLVSCHLVKFLIGTPRKRGEKQPETSADRFPLRPSPCFKAYLLEPHLTPWKVTAIVTFHGQYITDLVVPAFQSKTPRPVSRLRVPSLYAFANSSITVAAILIALI